MPNRSKSFTPPVTPPPSPAASRRGGPSPEGLLGRAGIGPARAKSLGAAGVASIEDLLWWLPSRYEDRRHPRPLASLKPDEWVCVHGEIRAIKARRGARKGLHITEALLADETGNLHVVWFNQPWLAMSLPPGTEIFAYGKVSLFSTRAGLRLQMDSPEVEKVAPGGDGGAHTNRIVPIYRKLADLSARPIRSLMFKVLEGPFPLEERLPSRLLSQEGLPGLEEAFRNAHFPSGDTDIHALETRCTAAHRRLIFEELLGLQWVLRTSKGEREALVGVVVDKQRATGDFLRQILPFHLTNAQRRALREIFDDMASPAPMYRLLHGEVGSGKTLVAFLAMAACVHQGFQAAFMAPTEVLAAQQFRKLEELMASTGLKAALLTSSVIGTERRRVLRGLASGEISMAVGTHSLFQEKVAYARLGLAVIDEQHRFGVEQRARLVAKGTNPNVLVMTATPIPRSLAMTIYGDLDLSVLDELPPGRQPAITAVRDESARHRVETFLRKEMDAGRQVFAVFPLVEESEALDVRAAVEAYARFQAGPFRGYRLALLHGRMSAAKKEEAMARLRSGEVQLLVATTVVELGVDLPEASVMVVEHAERFGLAQLHQLRGRVGRGGQKGYCILMRSTDAGAEGAERLVLLEKLRDGFALAEADLALRGEGDPAGTRQWGGNEFRVANPLRDFDMLERAREWARRLVTAEFQWEPGEEGRFRTWASSVRYLWGSFGRIG